MKKIKKLVKICLSLFLLLLIYILGISVSIMNYATKDETQPADVIIVLGAAAYDSGVSPVFRERLNHAINLYNEGYADTIIVTG